MVKTNHRRYVGYWFCPRCGAENLIPGWTVDRRGRVVIELSPAGPYRKMIFTCEHCQETVFEFGLKEAEEEEKEEGDDAHQEDRRLR